MGINHKCHWVIESQFSKMTRVNRIASKKPELDMVLDEFGLVWLSSVLYGWIWLGVVEFGFVWMTLVWCCWVWFGMDELVWCGWVHFGVDEVGLVWLSLTVWVWFGEVYFCFVWKMTWIKMLLLTLGGKKILIFLHFEGRWPR